MKCEHPYFYHGKLLRCGKCLACRRYRCRDWEARVLCEHELLKRGCYFVTLTYDEEHLPEGRNLNPRHLSLYVKRLRKVTGLNSRDMKIISVGEYGSRRGRPHYHLLLIGLPIDSGNEEKICQCWKQSAGQSYVHVSAVRSSRAAVRYTICYMLKHESWYSVRSGETKSDFEARTGLVAPFQRFSNGMGSEYCVENKDRLIELGFLQFGREKFCIPRYFVRKLNEVKSNEEVRREFRHVVDYVGQKISKFKKEKSVLYEKIVRGLSDIDIDYVADFYFYNRKLSIKKARIRARLRGGLNRFEQSRLVKMCANFFPADVEAERNKRRKEYEVQKYLQESMAEAQVKCETGYTEEYIAWIYWMAQRWNNVMMDVDMMMEKSVRQAGCNECARLRERMRMREQRKVSNGHD